ncbi:MAG TPA: hypothetical protein VM577_16870 [Anaerovoracaceae bacterium]|nr:hypothetical protein [Anaerovoracaceae bacterium]
MIRETQFFKVLSEECFIDHEYDIIQLCQILRKELIRSRKYTVNEDGEINDFNDFARVMIHEIVYNSSLTIGCKLSLAQVSFIVENIPNFTVDEKDVQIIKKLRDKYLEKIQ